MEKIIVTNKTEYHHMPDHETRPNLQGMTLRRAISKLRSLDFGNIGGTHQIELSDGTYIGVELTPSSENTALMSSQRIRRARNAELYERGYEKTVRYYKLN